MVRLRFERFYPGIANKLYACNFGPYKVLKWVKPNAYVLDLPLDLGISSTFNIEDLLPYHSPSTTFVNPFLDQQTPSTPFPQSISPLLLMAHRWEVVEDILDKQAFSIRQGSYQRYLVKWKDRLRMEYMADAGGSSEIRLRSVKEIS